MQRILVVRNDKLGDFMLAWPSFAMLKASMPDAHVVALVPSYTAPLAKLCPWLDDIVVDVGKDASKHDKERLVQIIKAQQFDASINLFSNHHNARVVRQARIPYRLAPATKWVQVLYNHRLKQRRSHSAQPEYEYNLDLIRHFLKDHGQAVVEPSAPYLSFTAEALQQQRADLARKLGLNHRKKWCFVHVGSGGSANNLSLAQYAQLINELLQTYVNTDIVLTAGPGEAAQAQALHALLVDGSRAVVYADNDGLVDFARSIGCADLFIAGSTGPLHLAAALDIPTIGFFPSKRSSTPLRWRPINGVGRHLAFAPPTGASTENDMSQVDLVAAIAEIKAWLPTFRFESTGLHI
ncbi:MAG: glycosyltransferase family 9 protein [Neisseriaceae bacterium]|nr:glycosyltransferase family 9 protein [Neisseriaceae bacterium]MBP6862826.1 glycosyltransferase family 9 protein [Neisseriaceae bacterium]